MGEVTASSLPLENVTLMLQVTNELSPQKKTVSIFHELACSSVGHISFVSTSLLEQRTRMFNSSFSVCSPWLAPLELACIDHSFKSWCFHVKYHNMGEEVFYA